MYKNYISEQIFVKSGVLQGDHLSSILFCLFINDVNFLSKIVLLLDNANIFKYNISCLDDAI